MSIIAGVAKQTMTARNGSYLRLALQQTVMQAVDLRQKPERVGQAGGLGNQQQRVFRSVS